MLLPETVFPVKLIAVKSNVFAFAFTFFVFYVIPRVESLSYLTLSKPGQAHYEVYSRFLCLCWLCANRIYFMVDLGGIEPPSNMPYFTTLPYGYNNSLNQRFFLVALLAARSIGVGFLRDIIVSLISNIIYPTYAG